MISRRVAKKFEMSDFSRGMAFGHPTGTPGDLDIRSTGFLVTPEGWISANVGYIGITPFPATGNTLGRFLEHLNQLFWWERPSGGGVLLLATSQLYDSGWVYRVVTSGVTWKREELTSSPEGGASFELPTGVNSGSVWPQRLEELVIGERRLEVECRDNNVFIDFVPYGDYCFVFDGVNAPLLIHPNLTVTAAEAPIIGGAIFPHVRGGGITDALKVGNYVYAFTPVMRALGEGGAGYSQHVDDESFLSVTVPAVSEYGSGNWRIPNVEILGSYTEPEKPPFSIGMATDGEQVGGGIVELSNFASYFCSIPNVSAIKIYRTRQGTAGEYFYVGTVVEGEETFVDTVPDVALGARMDVGIKNPPRGRLAATYNDRLFVVGDLDAGMHNLIRFSERFRPLRFPESYFLYNPHLFRDDEILRVVQVGGVLYFLMRSGIVRLAGSTPADFSLEVVSTSLGIIAPRSLSIWRDGVIFLSNEGPVYLSAGGVKSLAGNLRGFFLERGHSGFDWALSVGVATKNYYYLSFHDDYYSAQGPSYGCSRVLAVCMSNGAWSDATSMPFDSAVRTSSGRALVSRNKKVGVDWGGVYELQEDFPWHWQIGASAASADGLCRSDAPLGIGHECNLKFNGLDLGEPGVRKVIDRVEIVYSGYAANNWGILITSDDSTVNYGSSSGDTDHLDYLAWNSDNNGEDSPERKLHTQVIYVDDQPSVSGMRFDLQVYQLTDVLSQVVMWAEVRRILVYYNTEDSR